MPSPDDGNTLSCGPLIEAHLYDELGVSEANRLQWEVAERKRDYATCEWVFGINVWRSDEDVRS